MTKQSKETKRFLLPLFLESVKAGFPSPAEDFLDKRLDLNSYIIKHPEATFFVRASGESMKNAGINSGDVLVVDRSLDAKSGDIVIASINSELTVKRLEKHGEIITLLPENPEFRPIEITPESDFSIWGVVVAVVHKFTK